MRPIEKLIFISVVYVCYKYTIKVTFVPFMPMPFLTRVSGLGKQNKERELLTCVSIGKKNKTKESLTWSLC
jgi:hypothetical protein